MKYKVEKCLQLINDLMLYCYGLGGDNFHIDYRPGGDQSTFTLKVEVRDLKQEVIDELIHALTQQRQQEVEEMYWSISFDTGRTCELTAIGVMLDEVHVEYDGEVLSIAGTRLED